MQDQEYLQVNSAQSSTYMLGLVYMELVLFIALFIRISEGDTELVTIHAVSLVVGVILVLSTLQLATIPFSILLCKEFLHTSMGKSVMNLTGLHFSHVLIGYLLLLHDGKKDAELGILDLSINLASEESMFSYLYWYLVEAL